MKPTLLVFNVTDKKRVAGIKKSLLLLGIRGKFVNKELYDVPIGMIFEGKFPDNYGKYDSEELTEEMIVMGGFTSSMVDKLIASFYKNGVGKINLKAMLTETNAEWNAQELFLELKKEHEQFTRE